MPTFVVNTALLNFRSTPAVNDTNVIATLRRGQSVTSLGPQTQGWLNVSVTLSANVVNGYVAAQYLMQPPPAEPLVPVLPAAAGGAAALVGPWQPSPSTSGLSAAWFKPRAESNLASTNLRHVPIGQAGLPVRDGATAADKARQLSDIVRGLDVEHSARYGPDTSHTYCNIYATDFCWLARAYLPRVWWEPTAIKELGAGNAVAVDYGKTVHEVNANSLYDWLATWGDDFGWQREVDLNKIQDHVNGGGVGVLCAKRKDASRSGHITAIVPEFTGQSAQRQGAAVLAPLQSQAGGQNHAWFSSAWWITLASTFQASGFWLHA